MSGTCQWKIRWTHDTDAQCEKDRHIDQVIIQEFRDKKFSVTTIGDGKADTHKHHAHVGPHSSVLTWSAGDRREYTGDWPGPCPKLEPPSTCTLPAGHHGRCAP